MKMSRYVHVDYRIVPYDVIEISENLHKRIHHPTRTRQLYVGAKEYFVELGIDVKYLNVCNYFDGKISIAFETDLGDEELRDIQHDLLVKLGLPEAITVWEEKDIPEFVKEAHECSARLLDVIFSRPNLVKLFNKKRMYFTTTTLSIILGYISNATSLFMWDETRGFTQDVDDMNMYKRAFPFEEVSKILDDYSRYFKKPEFLERLVHIWLNMTGMQRPISGLYGDITEELLVWMYLSRANVLRSIVKHSMGRKKNEGVYPEA